MDSDIAVKVSHVSKTFKLPHEKHTSLKSALINFRNRGYEIQQALKDVSFEVKKGEFFGIVGRNGSGKSTLLKLIAGIYTPDSGTITVNGKLVPFIELGVGFNPELSGRENVYLNGALLGFSRKEMEAMYDDIVHFAELERFMDQKLKNYSSGMQVRLAFSIATRVKGDLLILDEVLAVGDEAFQRKCREYFYKLKREKKTVILVTHSMESVRSFCDKGILIDQGKIVKYGNPDEIAARYSETFQKEYIEQKQHEESPALQKNHQKGDVYVKSIEVLEDGKRTRVVGFRKDFSIKCNISSDKDYDNLVMGLHVVNESGQTIMAITTKTFRDNLKLRKGLNVYTFDIQNILSEGEYSISIAVKHKTTGVFLIQDHDVHTLSIIGLDTAKYNPVSLTYPDVKLSIE